MAHTVISDAGRGLVAPSSPALRQHLGESGYVEGEHHFGAVRPDEALLTVRYGRPMPSPAYAAVEAYWQQQDAQMQAQ